ncbi:hypothetical protein BD770DRAFT_391019, partial [Pilaira anomala]
MFVILSRKKVSLLSLLLLYLCVLLWLAVVNPILHRVCLNYKSLPLFPFLLVRSHLLLIPFLLFFRLLGTIHYNPFSLWTGSKSFTSTV